MHAAYVIDMWQNCSILWWIHNLNMSYYIVRIQLQHTEWPFQKLTNVECFVGVWYLVKCSILTTAYFYTVTYANCYVTNNAGPILRNTGGSQTFWQKRQIPVTLWENLLILVVLVASGCKKMALEHLRREKISKLSLWIVWTKMSTALGFMWLLTNHIW